jgi:4-amino-4-deoxy-L-arabinose transferase-like glycosyltransferase
MEKAIRITGLLSLLFALLTVIIWGVVTMWNPPINGIVHNLLRVSVLCWLVIGGVWVFMFTYQETKN